MGHSLRPHVNPVLQPCSPGVSRHCPLPLTPPTPPLNPPPHSSLAIAGCGPLHVLASGGGGGLPQCCDPEGLLGPSGLGAGAQGPICVSVEAGLRCCPEMLEAELLSVTSWESRGSSSLRARSPVWACLGAVSGCRVLECV